MPVLLLPLSPKQHGVTDIYIVLHSSRNYKRSVHNKMHMGGCVGGGYECSIVSEKNLSTFTLVPAGFMDLFSFANMEILIFNHFIVISGL